MSAGRQGQDCSGVNTPGKAEKALRVRLRELRQKAGLTQEAYAEQAKFSYKYYQGIERGQWTNLRLRTLEKLLTIRRIRSNCGATLPPSHKDCRTLPDAT